METVTTKLLEEPIDYAEALTRTMGAGEINAKARQFCRSFETITGKFPFNPSAKTEATIQELNSMFRPLDGQLWTFYNDTLQNLMQKKGTQYAANPAGGIQLTPAFVAFFNNAARFSDALYPGGMSEPLLRYSLTPQRTDQIRDISITINGKTNNGMGTRPYTWTGSDSQNVRIIAKLYRGSDLELQNRQGLWSLFRFFSDADLWHRSGNGFTVDWTARQGGEGRPVIQGGKELKYRFTVDTGVAAPVFQKDFLDTLRCVSPAAR
jgi:type VI secretion system protein ImpL